VNSVDDAPLTCPTCGRPVDAHDRHVRFRLPDPVLAVQDQEHTQGTWLSHADANQSVMMMVPTVGTFVRSLLPVRLTGGHTVTFGVWIGVHPDELQRAFAIWWEPEYVDLWLDGRLANALPGWGLLATQVDAAVLNVDETPYVVRSSDPTLDRVLSDEWPHDEVLSRLP
jgi:hypothetical protein